MSAAYERQISTMLSKDDLTQALILTNRCLNSSNEIDLNSIILSFSAFLNFEFVLYAYTIESYQNEHNVYLKNLSNPEKWAIEYDRKGFLNHDPVRHEMERLLAAGATSSFILWDDYTWELSSLQQQVIERRNHYGLKSGFSFFINSKSKDFFFLFSFASKKTVVTSRAKVLCDFLGQHLMAARKRIVILDLIATLSKKEKIVATWIMKGKTNMEIAEILHVTTNTVKFHAKNILPKLHVTNRQQAIAILMAERYLSI